MLAAVFDFSFPDAAADPGADIVNPNSPTSSAYVSRLPGASSASIVANSGKTKAPRAACRVSFAPASKNWDGLKVNSLVLDALVVRYFVRQQECSELDVLDIASGNLDVVDQLVLDLQDLAVRIELALSNGVPSEPVLPQGGGANVKLSLAHLPYVRILLKVVSAAQTRLRNSQQRFQQ